MGDNRDVGRFWLFHKRLGAFFRSLSWRELEPVEEGLAVAAVSTKPQYLFAPLLVLMSAGMSWAFFPAEQGTDRWGLFFGTVSIVLMAWSFVLGTRWQFMEWAFGGFDRLHVWHRWVGALALVFLLLHSNAENSVQNGEVPFGRSVEDFGVSLGELAQTVLIVLIVVSIFRILPYRIWRFSHLGMVIPFVFSAFHVLTAERPFGDSLLAEGYLWAWSAIGLIAFVYRVLVVDSGFFDTPAAIADIAVDHHSASVSLIAREGSSWSHVTPGQFVYLRLGGVFHEAHPFSVTAFTDDPRVISVHIAQVGDWTTQVSSRFVPGAKVRVSRPHGHLRLGGEKKTVWIAGGSGITPFLQRPSFFAELEVPPTLVYFFRGKEKAIGLDYFTKLSDQGLIRLRRIDTTRETVDRAALLSEEITAGSHVAVCGPRALVSSVLRIARKTRASSASFELYDYRSPFGPNLNPLLRILLEGVLPHRVAAKLRFLVDNDIPKETQNSPSPMVPTAHIAQ